ncbi:MAG: cytochrome c oxidase subunit II [Chloroflexi bacterium]|nr:cytochrome c oxidase subunit II [Chloroflexota bacterium]
MIMVDGAQSEPTMKRHLIIVFVVATVLATVLAYVFSQVNLIPNPSSEERTHIDYLMKVLLIIGGAIFALIVTVFTYSLLFFRSRPGDKGDGLPLKGYSPLEMAWTAIPLLIVLVLGSYGGIVLNRMTSDESPQTVLRVNVTSARFSWQFEYPEYGITSFVLELPVNRQTILYLQSTDVVHSFWVPEFGPKQDAVPGMTTELRITPQKEGQYQVRCSQLCGYGHSFMTAPVSVVSEDRFQSWVEQQRRQ